MLPLTIEERQTFETDGFLIRRGLVDQQAIEALRQALWRTVEEQAATAQVDGDALFERDALAAPESIPLSQRFRKLSRLVAVPEYWQAFVAHPAVLAIVGDFLGPDILCKYSSAFLKPAEVGGATPWHQDIGLWGDQNSGAMNAWMAIDPATRANGCLQVVPGSHLGPVIPHRQYPDGIHAELPRDRCQDLTVAHIELAPGDVVFWHSHLWHYSPPNRSPFNRIGCGCVWVAQQQIAELIVDRLTWVQRDAAPLAFPGEELLLAAAGKPAAGGPY